MGLGSGSLWFCVALLSVSLSGCLSPASYREQADSIAYAIIHHEQIETLGHEEPFTIERPEDTLRKRLLIDQNLPVSTPLSYGREGMEPISEWPDAKYLEKHQPPAEMMKEWQGKRLQTLTLKDALEIGARSSRDYQNQKELVFQAALSLDLERNQFRNIWSAVFSSEVSRDLGSDPKISGSTNSGVAAVTRQLKTGGSIAVNLAVDLAKLLTQQKDVALGLLGDATVTIPLLRGAGRFVVTEPLTQAQRNVIYAIYDFERFKRVFAVQIASQYFAVLEQLDQIHNAEENYKGLIASTRRVRRLADAGRVPEDQVDQSRSRELVARDRWIGTRQSYQRQLDSFKELLGLPTDANVSLDRGELERLAKSAAKTLETTTTTKQEKKKPPTADTPVVLEPPSHENAGPLEMNEKDAIRLAFEHRLDLRIAVGAVFDAQRLVAVDADDLRADVTLLGSATAGERRTSPSSAGLPDAELRPERGYYSALLTLNLPIERTLERNNYRGSLIGLESSIRDVQGLEDQIKFQVRDNLRSLLQSRESYRIQAQAVEVAQRRVDSTSLLLQAGRVEIRDVLDAQDALISAQNALTAALVRYRVSELELQRDLGVLRVDEKGLWTEYNPKRGNSNEGQ